MATVSKELLVKYAGDTKSLEQATARASGSITKLETSTKRASRNVSSSFISMGKALTPFIGAFAGIASIDAFIKISDEASELKGRLDNATRSTQEARIAMEALRTTAGETGTQLDTTISVFQRLSFVRDEINASVDDMTQFTDVVSKLGVVSGASTGSLNAGLTQLGQALSNEIVRAEEFNSIMENIPAIGVAIAKELEVSTGQLRQMVINGELLSKDVFQAILNQADEANEKFEKMPVTFRRAGAELGTEFKKTIGLINESTGATNILVTTLQKAADLLKLINRTRIEKLTDRLGELESRNSGKINSFFESGEISMLKKELESLNAEQANTDALETIRNTGDEYARQTQMMQRALSASREQAQETVQSSKVLSMAQSSQDRLTQAIGRSTYEQEDFNQAIENTFEDFSRGLINGETSLKSFRNVALNALQDILTSMLRLSTASQGGGSGGLLNTIAQSAFSFIGGQFGVGNGGTFDPLKGAPAAKPSFSSGGSFVVSGNSGIDRNTLSLNGQAIANVSKGETVGVGRSGAGGSGVTINQNINLSMGVQQTVQSEIQRFLPQFKKVSVDAYQEAKSRGVIS